MNINWHLVELSVIGALFVLAAASIAANYFQWKHGNDLIEHFNGLKNTFIVKSGVAKYSDGHELPYTLLSLNGGATWLAGEKAERGWNILDEVDKVHPGLLAAIEAHEALAAHIRTNGPIDPRTEGGRAALEAAGFAGPGIDIRA